MFVPKWTVVAVKLFYFFNSTLLAHQWESSGMAALFSKLSRKKTIINLRKQHLMPFYISDDFIVFYIHENTKIL